MIEVDRALVLRTKPDTCYCNKSATRGANGGRDAQKASIEADIVKRAGWTALGNIELDVRGAI